MCECKMYRLSEGMEHQYITEDSEIRLFMSFVRSKKKKRRTSKIFEKTIMFLLNVCCSLSASIVVGYWALEYAYAERGYMAFGGEYLLIVATFVLCFCVIKNIFD